MQYALVALTILATPVTGEDFTHLRELMVQEQIEARGVRSPEVLAAMRAVPRHLFVPPEFRFAAYEDTALPIGHDQSISQPVIAALMTELLEARRSDRVLEIGTGSGYQAAVPLAFGEAGLYYRNHQAAGERSPHTPRIARLSQRHGARG